MDIHQGRLDGIGKVEACRTASGTNQAIGFSTGPARCRSARVPMPTSASQPVEAGPRFFRSWSGGSLSGMRLEQYGR